MPERREIVEGTVHGIKVKGPWFNHGRLHNDRSHTIHGCVMIHFVDEPTEATEYGSVYVPALNAHGVLRIEKYGPGPDEWIAEKLSYVLDD